jgi:ABC-type sugar transport system permease subunit
MLLKNVDVVRGTSSFIGLGNYLRLFHDGQFGLSVLNTAWYTLTVVPLIVIGSIVIAVFLRESRPARLIARVGFYIPFVLSPVVVATSWKSTLAMLPVLLVFLCFQRYFLKGSLSGGVKG